MGLDGGQIFRDLMGRLFGEEFKQTALYVSSGMIVVLMALITTTSHGHTSTDPSWTVVGVVAGVFALAVVYVGHATVHIVIDRHFGRV